MNTPLTYDQAIALLRKQPATYDTPVRIHDETSGQMVYPANWLRHMLATCLIHV